MKTHIFFDTNILEIFNGKDFSKFELANSFYEIKEIVKYFEIGNKVEFYIPQLVLNEMIKHYKEGYKDKIEKANEIVSEINLELNTVLKNELKLEPIYSKREYYLHFETIVAEYLKNNIVNVSPYPKNLEKVIERALEGKTPFTKISKGKKEYKDAGFKDVIIWKTIINTKYENEDRIIFLTKDNDFGIDVLKNEIKNNFDICRSVEGVKTTLLNIYDIDEEIFKVQKYIFTEYFQEQLKDKIEDQYFHFNRYVRNDIVLDFSNIEFENVKWDEEEPGITPKKINIEGTLIDTPEEWFKPIVRINKIKADIYYFNKAKNVNMHYKMILDCHLRDKEFVEILLLEGGSWDFEKGDIIEDLRTKNE